MPFPKSILLVLLFPLQLFSQNTQTQTQTPFLQPIDLSIHKPDLPPEAWQKKPYLRLYDQMAKRDAARHPNMDWARWQAWQKLQNSPQNKTSTSHTWENFGPDKVSGRIISIAFHPTDTNTMYVGSAAGGLWRSIDYGQNWEVLTDDYPTMGVGAVAINPQNPNSLLIATGEGYSFGGEFTSGFGILISHDAGLSWDTTNVNGTLAQSFTGMDIIWNPNDTNKVSVGTSFGVYYSGDGGASYAYVLDRLPSRIVADPVNPDTLYMSARYYSPQFPGGFYRSYDAGQTWNHLSGNNGLPALTDFGYASIALHPVYRNMLYLNISQSSVNGLGPMEGLYKSRDYGNSWTQITPNIDIQCYHPPYNNICQGWFANTISISPRDTNTLIAGGTRLWKSVDGGSTWTDIDLNQAGNAYDVHPDHHQTLYHPLTEDLFDCNDGGVNYSSNLGQNWSNISDGLITHQFYTIAVSQADPDVVMGGAQDVGTFSTTTAHSIGNWTNNFSGDSFGSAMDHQNKDTWYSHRFMNFIRLKTTDAGLNWNPVNQGTFDADQWRAPLTMHPTDPQTLFSGGNGILWRTNNGGTQWQAMTGNIGGDVGTIEYSPADPNIVYASKLFDGTMYRSSDGGQLWYQFLNSPGTPVTDIAADPSDPAVVYATIGSYAVLNQVFMSVDTGKNWANISSNLPEVPANSIVVDPFDYKNLYVGTDLGVFMTENGGLTWSEFNDGLPYVPVDDMHYYEPDSTIRIGTYGRGYWRAKAVEPTVPVGIEGDEQLGFAELYPNPVRAGGAVNLAFYASRSMSGDLEIWDMKGEKVGGESWTLEPGKNERVLRVPDVAGMYLLSLEIVGERYSLKMTVLE